MERGDRLGSEAIGTGAHTGGDSVTVDLPVPGTRLTAGADLGGRYRIRSLVGAGGMGEVWRAYDLKLQVDVALKVLRGDVATSERHLQALRQEVRAARQVVSPNVCRIYQLEEIDGLELVSMEYVDGQTLLEVLKERGPLDLKEAQDIASQFLAGLEAIHTADFIHRDVKPENIMVTRAGRVVVMDFGLARHATDPSRSASGTPAYMAPEQARGEPLDARADVYAAGVVLAEMVSPGGVKDLASRRSLWQAVRSDPPQLPDSPWVPVIRRAVARDREQRYRSAHTLTRALEEVTLRVVGADDLTPYPGLASFTEQDAEYFFGREAEVEALWRKLEGPPRMLGLVGPSGTGKTSFIRAGLIPGARAGWGIVRCTPGGSAIASLRSAMTPELAGDTEVLQTVMADPDNADVLVQAIASWRRRHGNALVIVDQFEELFTLNRQDERLELAGVLGRLPVEADVHVVVSMRDDFAASCHALEALRAIFHDLTVLDPLAGSSLRRALVQPALRCGYRFEDDELVEAMLGEVEGERGALPLLAFAVARLWEMRDREEGLLTRGAYRDIEGVGGALARHAEATVDRIGVERVFMVRELFRNLVTAESTRAVREWNDLLSVFDDHQRAAAGEVLCELIDARLLTSYEVQQDEREPTRRVEIIHESLLASWPRLVRWQIQDADAARLRDELRQAARTWDEHGRQEDRLWSGSAYREYRMWRERYPGGLTELEEAFARAMTALAMRRRRRRRLTAAVVLMSAVAVGAVTTTLWRRSVAETRRAEAGELLALARTQLEGDPTAALAYTRASLDLIDTPEARRFAVEVLWSAPIARILPVEQLADEAGVSDGPYQVSRFALSPDGRWLATADSTPGRVLLFPLDGGPPRALPRQADGNVEVFTFGPDSDLLITGGADDRMVFWSVPELEQIRSVELGGVRTGGAVDAGDDKLWTITYADTQRNEISLRVWSLPEGEPEVLEGPGLDQLPLGFGLKAGLAVQARDRTVVISPLDPQGGEGEQVLGDAGDVVVALGMNAGGDLVLSIDRSGEVRVWSTDADDAGLLRVVRGLPVEARTGIGPTGRYFSAVDSRSVRLWDLRGPRGSEPRVLQRRVPVISRLRGSLENDGRWAVTNIGDDTIEFWPLGNPWVRVFHDVTQTIGSMDFTSDGRWLATCPGVRPVHLRPLNPADGEPRDLDPPTGCVSLATHPTRNEILVGTSRSTVFVYPVAGGTRQRLPGDFGWRTMVWGTSFDPGGRRAAASPFSRVGGFADPEQRVLRVWDLESGAEQVCSVAHLTDQDWPGSNGLGFAYDGALYASLGGGGRVMRLALPTVPGDEVTAEMVVDAGSSALTMSRDGRFLLVHASETRGGSNILFEQLVLFDLVHGTSRRITTHGTRLSGVAEIDPTGRILVTGDGDGVVRAGPINGSAPHLLIGHEYSISSLAISPDSRWIASASDDSIRLWPMPDVTRPPLHTLPHDELMAKLDDFTNLRAVRDEASATGWTLEVGPFAGRETVPSW